MAKKEVVEVNFNEDDLRKMIAGNISSTSETKNVEMNAVEKYNTPFIGKDIETEPATLSTNKNPKRKAKLTYSDLFFDKKKIYNRKQFTVYISEDSYNAICNILQLTKGLSMVSLINNIIEQHLIDYEDEINNLYKNFMSNFFKK